MNRRLVALMASMSFVVAALGVGWWGLLADRADHAHDTSSPSADWAPGGDGWVRVTGFTDRSMTGMRMPGMATMPDPDPVPDGFTRVSVNVELAAGESPLRWRAVDFVITGQGTEPLTPHSLDLGDGMLPPGTRVAGGLTYDVPNEATELSFVYAGDASFPLDQFREPGDSRGDGNHVDDDDHHDEKPADHHHDDNR